MPVADTVPALFAGLLRQDAARPLLTYYDLSTGERVELSVATTDNWVAKTANLLQDSLAVTAGARVRVVLPVHWQAVVWALATWRAGCVLVGDVDRVEPDVAVTTRADASGAVGGDVVVLALQPMGARSADPAPAGVLDYDAEVLGHGDHFSGYHPPGPDSAAVELEHATTSHSALLRAVGTQADPPRPRLLVTEPPTGAAILPAWLAALAAGGSLVLVRGATEPAHAEALAELVAAEHVTARH